MKLTLKSIKERQDELSKMIDSFESENKPKSINIQKAVIDLAAGEHYAGIILGDDGIPAHHLILLPDAAEDISWADAKEWADKNSGELPSRREQSLLYANLPEQFDGAWYWTSTQHTSDSDSAWCQDFGDGLQYDYHKDGRLRARAVRRLII